MELKLSFQKLDKALVITLDGEFDLHTAEKFKKRVGNKIAAGNTRIILDLGGVEFIDSSGLGAILSKYKKLDKMNGKLIVTNVTPQVKRIFEVSGILRIIDIYSSQKEALDNI
ncbi:anti-anti-sigma factor [Halobacteroides halobius DSM 5150]|uniref:Anti-sigma factor antagonist n=1 Tax=Halobacteroides halobius (strain ATCC 35273 / DSM 5150 / MD-1) TaxID=748449 RepID=L0K7N1_HALHC|nr:anti-sigma factor antagonist [Halobacteroides halobius]AGB40560.1 anti-anti-sigma factor [Halobacteroides halobius DSM 5150]